MSVLYILPLAVFGHLLSATFFYSRQAHVDVPLVYYMTLAVLAYAVMARITGGLSMQPRSAAKDEVTGEAHEIEEALGHNGGPLTSPTEPIPAGRSTGLSAHLEGIEMYVPPLCSALLLDMHATSAERRASHGSATQVAVEAAAVPVAPTVGATSKVRRALAYGTS